MLFGSKPNYMLETPYLLSTLHKNTPSLISKLCISTKNLIIIFQHYYQIEFSNRGLNGKETKKIYIKPIMKMNDIVNILLRLFAKSSPRRWSRKKKSTLKYMSYIYRWICNFQKMHTQVTVELWCINISKFIISIIYEVKFMNYIYI